MDQIDHRLFQQILERVPDALYVYDLTTGATSYINSSAQKVLGYSAAEVAERGSRFGEELWHPDDAATLPEHRRRLQLLRDGETHEMEYRVRQPDGGYRWMRSRTVVFARDAEGAVWQIVGSVQDITTMKHAEDAVRRSDERFRRYFDLGLIGMAITSPSTGILQVNDEICNILGYDRSELLRLTWQEITHPDDVGADLAHFRRVAAGEIDRYELDKRWIRKDGRTVWSTISVGAVRREDRSIDYFVAFLQDITDRKQAEQALIRARDELERRVAARTSQLTELNRQLANEVDERTHAETQAIELRNTLAAEVTAMRRLHDLSTRFMGEADVQQLLEDVLDATIAVQHADFGHLQLINLRTNALEIVAQRGFAKECLDYFAGRTDESAASGRTGGRAERVVIEDVETDRHFAPHRGIAAAAGFRAVQSTPLLDRTGTLLGVLSTHFRHRHRPTKRELRLTDLYVGQAVDMIQRKRSEAALLEYQQELRHLTARLIEVQEAQTRNLARELHDDVSQQLAAIAVTIAGLAQTSGIAGQATLMRVVEDINRLAFDVHRVSRQLHPAILEDLGLAAALKSECLAFSEQYGMAAEFESFAVPQSIPRDVALCLYRIAQESLRNAGKHAGGSNVHVTLGATDGELTLVIADRGVGFDREMIKNKRRLGLVSMDERVRLVGGTLAVISRPGEGTQIVARVPLHHNTP